MTFWITVTCCLLMAICGPAHAQVPLPSDLSVKVPAANVPQPVALFSGAWGNGAWNGTRPAALVVERIDADGTTSVVYAWGASEQSGIAPAWRRMQGHIENGQLTLQSPQGAVLSFHLDPSGHLNGSSTMPEGWRSLIVLKNIPGTAAEVIATAALPVQPIWQDIRISEHSRVGNAGGQKIELQATLYRSDLPGRQPLVILNHGAADGERPSVPTIHRFEDQARYFLSRGYNVVVPMRKGRGLSGGPMLEPSDHSIGYEIQVDSAVEDLDTVVNAMRAEPWVDPARVIVAGWSRGGFLSVIYAARHPDKVEGVINFCGGWWSEFGPGADFNTAQLARAGRGFEKPELWLYADNDHYYSLPYTRKNFDAFRANGGTGDYRSFEGIQGNGHALFGYIGMWDTFVADYLRKVDGTEHANVLSSAQSGLHRLAASTSNPRGPRLRDSNTKFDDGRLRSGAPNQSR